MLAAFGHDRDHVLLEDITSSIQELGWQELPARNAEAARVMPATNGEGTGNFSNGHRDHRQAPHGAAGDELSDTTNDGVTGGPAGRVIVVTEGRTMLERSLNVGRIIIGRTSDNDIQIDSRFVSRHHCQITTGTQGSVIEDLNSTNGIYVQGKRMRRYNLNDGDIVVIGKHEIMYVDDRLARARLNSPEGAAAVPTLAKAADEHAHTQTVVDTTGQAAKR
jgi:pSer/pThr/pTyr-binding forkhead associated (FHA) protein